MSKRRRKKLADQDFPAHIEKLNHEGRGITHIDGKTIFIDDALEGEDVTFRYTRCYRNHDEGRSVAINTPSPHRVEPICPHYGMCGGCRLQHMSHEQQIQHKQKVFLELLQHQANVQPKQILAPLTGPQTGYRRKARLSVKYLESKQMMLVGFRERNGRFVANIDECHVLDPQVGQHIPAIKAAIANLSIKQHIPQIEVAVGDDACALVIRHLQAFNSDDLMALAHFAEQQNYHIYLQPGGYDTVTLLYPNSDNPLLSYRLDDYNLALQFHPTQFTQINKTINDNMLKQALNLLALDEDDNVLDLFCGIGNFSLPMARSCKHVTGLEADATAIERATANAQQNALDNCTFITADLFADQADASWCKHRYDKVLLDPPRAGAKEILQYLPQWQAQTIVYVSCNPATLARDCQTILEHGYELQAAGIMDMFPHTQHVEAMCQFTLKK